jgi:HD-GYP domain-containing protein (c-di-GMP phosphodiesterase class II)
MTVTRAKPISLHSLLADPSTHDRQSLTARLKAIDETLWCHARAVATLVEPIADLLSIRDPLRGALIDAAWFHDIGKLAIPRSILLRPGPLDERAWVIMRQHPGDGADFLSSCPELLSAAPMVRHHHERYDGSGYPDGLVATRIPLEARIIGVADAFHAMTSARSYRPVRSRNEAIGELMSCAGTQFDPDMVEVFVNVHRDHTGHESR